MTGQELSDEQKSKLNDQQKASMLGYFSPISDASSNVRWEWKIHHLTVVYVFVVFLCFPLMFVIFMV